MQESFSSHNQCSFFTLSNQKESEVSVLLVHGYAEHTQRYLPFYEALDKEGFRVMGFDFRGHGKSEGDRAIIDSFEVYVDDMHALIQEYFQAGKKNFIFAHSMGGLVTMLYLQKYGSDHLTGVITSGAAMMMYEKPPAILEKLAGPLSKIFPKLPTVPVKPDVVSRDPEIVEKYISDPLNYTKPTKAKMGYEFLVAQKKGLANLAKINAPIFINHGSSDMLIHPDSSQKIYDTISSSDKKLKMWDGLYHEILNEPEKEEVTKEIVSWIKERI